LLLLLENTNYPSYQIRESFFDAQKMLQANNTTLLDQAGKAHLHLIWWINQVWIRWCI